MRKAANQALRTEKQKNDGKKEPTGEVQKKIAKRKRQNRRNILVLMMQTLQ